VLAPTLPGHAGGPPLDGEVTDALIPDAIERAMDEAGFETAHIVGNSLGGYVALQLAARGRADWSSRLLRRRLGQGRSVSQPDAQPPDDDA
jgi:pimeloyl-ACP methyl ester carboxylesterase